VPAPTSSRILAAARRPDAPVALAPDQCRSLLDDLAQITDPSPDALIGLAMLALGGLCPPLRASA
jgi:hypothetical protein